MSSQVSFMQNQLLKQLISTNKPLSSQFLANNLGVSSKTIRANLTKLSLQLTKNGAMLHSKTGKGYWLSVEDDQRFQRFLTHIHHSQTEFSIKYPLQKERAHLIVRYLLCQKGYTKIAELEELLYMNQTSVKQLLQVARTFLSEFNLKVVTKSRYGLKIVGQEHDLRMCMIYEVNLFETSQIDSYQENEYAELISYDEVKFKRIMEIIIEFQKTFSNLNLSVNNVINMARLIVLMNKRNKQGHFLDYNQETVNQFTNRNSYYISKMVIGKCTEILDDSFTRNDVILLSICFVGLRVLSSSEEMNREMLVEYKDIAFDIVQHITMMNRFSYVNKDIILVNVIARHLEGLFIRSKYHIKSSYFLCKGIVDISLMSKKMAVQALLYLQQHYGISISQEEIIYFANIIHPVFGRYPRTYDPISVAVLSDVNKNVGFGISERIKRNFEKFIDQIDVLELYEVTEKNIDQYSLVFTSFSKNQLPEFIPEEKVIELDVFFDEDYKLAIHNRLVNQHRIFLSFSEILDRDTIFTGIAAKNEEESLTKLYELLSQTVEVDSDFIHDLKLVEKLYPSNPSHNLVILSGTKSHTKRMMVAVLILKKPIVWGNGLNKTQVIVYFDSGERTDEAAYFENEYLPHLLDKVFSKHEIIDEMISNLNYEHLISFMEQYTTTILMTGSSFN